jgi:hypothetical protein
MGTPKSSISIGFSLINHPAIKGYPHLWNPPPISGVGPFVAGMGQHNRSAHDSVHLNVKNGIGYLTHAARSS